MTAPRSLAEQRRELRARLQAQRLALAAPLARRGEARDTYPRSTTMRWLIRERAVLPALVRWFMGTGVPALLAFGRLRRAAAVAQSATLAPPAPRE